MTGKGWAIVDWCGGIVNFSYPSSFIGSIPGLFNVGQVLSPHYHLLLATDLLSTPVIEVSICLVIRLCR
jgi:hypothetical protein